MLGCTGVLVILDGGQKITEDFVIILRWELESRRDDFTMAVYHVYGGLIAYT
jgi:hypothetical protein